MTELHTGKGKKGEYEGCEPRSEEPPMKPSPEEERRKKNREDFN